MSKNVLHLLSCRAQSAIINAHYDLDEPAKLRADIIAGKEDFKRLRNCGRKTILEIRTALGLGPKPKTCPHCGGLL